MFSNAKKLHYLKMLKTALLFLHSHLKTTVKLHITVFSEVSEYKTLNMYFTLLHMLFTILICSQHCAKEKNTPLFTKHVKFA